MLSRNHSDQEHEWSYGGQYEHHEAGPQTEGSRAIDGKEVSHLVLGAGIEPAWDLVPRDFKSLASTNFATRADVHAPAPPDGTESEEERSGKRDSNPRPQPWQGCALPTELFPRALTKLRVKIGPY